MLIMMHNCYENNSDQKKLNSSYLPKRPLTLAASDEGWRARA